MNNNSLYLPMSCFRQLQLSALQLVLGGAVVRNILLLFQNCMPAFDLSTLLVALQSSAPLISVKLLLSKAIKIMQERYITLSLSQLVQEETLISFHCLVLKRYCAKQQLLWTTWGRWAVSTSYQLAIGLQKIVQRP